MSKQNNKSKNKIKSQCRNKATGVYFIINIDNILQTLQNNIGVLQS